MTVKVSPRREPDVCSCVGGGSMCEGMSAGEAQRASRGLMRAEAGREDGCRRGRLCAPLSCGPRRADGEAGEK